MPVMKTNEWLNELYQNPIELCKKLEPLFPGISAKEIYEYFRLHGMYHERDKREFTLVDTMIENDIWAVVEMEHLALQKKWKGPDVPIIILPSNTTDKKLMKQTNGKAGLAFSDKLFLFVPENISEHELKALFIHEYNHVCRLWHTKKEEKSYTLLDSIILEGLAEHAVRERLGDAFTASWTNLHSKGKLAKIWDEIISPQKELLKSHPLHNQFLFGWDGVPRMAGYCVGYYLVGSYLNTNHLCINDIMSVNAKVISNLHPSG
ncbi:DUF2268 domain-containing protein [Sporosarcina gallistercoris]|uniref:DUF2268 domain-containing protein n=1 Tax=Sporosarcina gallistercoris TaxID=2762245 RepID=A0ABR8PMS8_9BACL|nr:DUF2268 domain-containing protein [Sporosarcina gallistercoris]MBD7909485.1 DUF2268 domain-containing protein [Sporosarcina gallistercoris]